jgi:hypothetical protein
MKEKKLETVTKLLIKAKMGWLQSKFGLLFFFLFC